MIKLLFLELLKNFKYVKAKPFEEESHYNPEFVKKILDDEKARKLGKKGLKIDVSSMEIELHEQAINDFEY